MEEPPMKDQVLQKKRIIARFPTSKVATLSVILLLLLIAIIFLIVILQKRSKVKAGKASTGSKCSVQDSGNNHEFEEVKDTRRLSTSGAKIFTVYSTAQLPTIPSDPSRAVYSNELPKSPCDSTLYSSAQLPTVAPDHDSTAQLPTGLSACSVSAAQQSAEEPAEDLTHAAVSFHANPTSSSDAAPKTIFNKEEISCDYDTISRVSSV
ncbi:uncharacterized protein LOC128614457 [Ictalurus furcatus]|uniref:uncharacterized protein LOC128614457 n=1 Tax=Ictalurus furcatus TaxID=66913 RepID=UPI00234FE46F|nr:uncharacterized protein LOC128614457 [Ictalurus furcatus]